MIGKYAFNAAAVFTTIDGYLRTTHDTSLLQEKAGNHSVDEWLDRIALDWQKHPSTASPLLADYGENPGKYLECVSTYVGAVPAIQAHTVGMLRGLAELRASQGNLTRAGELHKLAKYVASVVEELQYARGEGVWRSLYANGTAKVVRHCLDFINVGRLMAQDLPNRTRAEMTRFASEELVKNAHGWIRALSLRDPTIGADRPDHGKWGAYAAWPPLTAESFAELQDEGFQYTLEILRGADVVARQGPFGQATALQPSPQVSSPGVPFKTMYGITMYAADAGAAWAEAVIRTLFGYRPGMTLRGADGMLWKRDVRRTSPSGGFTGKLWGVMTPLGLADITLTRDGLNISVRNEHPSVETWI